MVKLSDITPTFDGQKIAAGQKINISRIVFTDIPAYGRAVTLYQGEEGFGTFSKAIVAKSEMIFAKVSHDNDGRLEEIIPVEVYARVSADRRTYLDLRDAE